MPHFDIPHLQDLLSQPIDGLTGLRKERVQGLFAQFDDTLSQNTRSIEQSVGNIVRTQTKLAEQCRPILHELVASQSGDNNIPGDTSSTMHTHSDHDTRDPVLRTSPPSPGKLFLYLLIKSSYPMSDCYASILLTKFVHLSPGHEIYHHCSFVSAQTLLSRQMPDHATICNTPGLLYSCCCMFATPQLCISFHMSFS